MFKMRCGIPHAYILDITVYKMHVWLCSCCTIGILISKTLTGTYEGGYMYVFVCRVYGADGARHHPHRKHDIRSGSQDHHSSKNSVQKTICCNSTSNALDDGRMCPKHVELRIHQ
jgi:hypothetical protein